jgi:site-specific recombinase XerD
MELLYIGVDTSMIAMWLGHEEVRSTQMYLHADIAYHKSALEVV